MATIDLQVAAGADDCQAYGASGFANTNSTQAIGDSGGSGYHSAARFTGVTIDNGDTIDVAYVSYLPDNNYTATVCNLGLYLENADDPGQIADRADWDSRVLTTIVAWNSVPSFLWNTWINSISIVAAVQTVVNRAGWASGQAMNAFTKNNGSDTSVYRSHRTFEGHATYGMKLHIEYTPGGGAAAFIPRVIVM